MFHKLKSLLLIVVKYRIASLKSCCSNQCSNDETLRFYRKYICESNAYFTPQNPLFWVNRSPVETVYTSTRIIFMDSCQLSWHGAIVFACLCERMYTRSHETNEICMTIQTNATLIGENFRPVTSLCITASVITRWRVINLPLCSDLHRDYYMQYVIIRTNYISLTLTCLPICIFFSSRELSQSFTIKNL